MKRTLLTIAILFFGFGFVQLFISEHEFWLQLIASVILCIIGLKIFFANPIKQYKAQREGKVGLLSDYVSLFFLTISNPVAIVLFLVYFSGTHAFGENPTFLIEAVVVLGSIPTPQKTSPAMAHSR